MSNFRYILEDRQTGEKFEFENYYTLKSIIKILKEREEKKNEKQRN